MLHRIHVIERAFQLADSGICRSRSEVVRALHAEGYPLNELAQFQGASLSRQLTDRCRIAIAASAAPAAA